MYDALESRDWSPAAGSRNVPSDSKSASGQLPSPLCMNLTTKKARPFAGCKMCPNVLLHMSRRVGVLVSSRASTLHYARPYFTVLAPNREMGDKGLLTCLIAHIGACSWLSVGSAARASRKAPAWHQGAHQGQHQALRHGGSQPGQSSAPGGSWPQLAGQWRQVVQVRGGAGSAMAYASPSTSTRPSIPTRSGRSGCGFGRRAPPVR